MFAFTILFASFAHAAPLTSECAAGSSWQYNAATFTMSCVPSAATNKTALVIECGSGASWVFDAATNKVTCTVGASRRPARGPVPPNKKPK